MMRSLKDVMNRDFGIEAKECESDSVYEERRIGMTRTWTRWIPSRRLAWVAWLAAGVGLVVGGGVGSARAELTVSAPLDVQASPGTSDPVNFFDVILSADPSGPAFEVNGFTVDVSISDLAGVVFTRATNETTTTYLFDGVNASPIDFNLFDGDTRITFFALGDSAADVRQVQPGQSFGLGRVYFNVAANAPESPAIPLVLSQALTEILDSSATGFTITLVDGSLRIEATPLNAIPEPTTWALTATLLGLVGGGVVRCRRHIRAA